MHLSDWIQIKKQNTTPSSFTTILISNIIVFGACFLIWCTWNDTACILLWGTSFLCEIHPCYFISFVLLYRKSGMIPGSLWISGSWEHFLDFGDFEYCFYGYSLLYFYFWLYVDICWVCTKEWNCWLIKY